LAKLERARTPDLLALNLIEYFPNSVFIGGLPHEALLVLPPEATS
jgi:hypothetical protein